MRAVVCRELRGPDALELADLPTPEPGACGVRIRVRAAGVNFADSLMLAGRYQEKPTLPFTPGLELAGEIEAVGAGVRGLRARAAGTGRGLPRRLRRAGGGARRGRGPAARRHGRRDRRRVRHRLRHGARRPALARRPACRARRCVVHGAGSGVGLTAVECGKAIGAVVIATARGEEKLAVAREHGADHAVDSEDPDLKGRLRELTDGRGADVVYDPVGGAVFDASLRAIAWEGRIVIIGFASGQVPQIPGQSAPGQERQRGRLLLGQLPQARPGATARRLQRSCSPGTARAGSGRSCRRPCPWRKRPTPSGCWSNGVPSARSW